MRTTARIFITGLVALAIAGTAGVHRNAALAAPAGGPPGPQEVEILAVTLDPQTQTPLVVLEGKRDHRRLAMTIGLAEATGIALPLQGVTPPRPLTHDLFLTLFGRLKVTITRVVITDLKDDTYYAVLHLSTGTTQMTLDSRPSDAIALALRAGVPVLVEERVFDKSGTAPATRGPRI